LVYTDSNPRQTPGSCENPGVLSYILNLTVPFLPIDPGPLKRLSITLLAIARGLFKKAEKVE